MSPLSWISAEYEFHPNSYVLPNSEADVCVCSLLPVLQDTGPFFPSCGKWKYLGWLCQHYIHLLTGSFLANHSLTLVLKPHISSLGTYKAWGIFRKHTLGPGPGSLVPLMHLPKAMWQMCHSHVTKWLLCEWELCYCRAEGCMMQRWQWDLYRVTWTHLWPTSAAKLSALVFPPASCTLPQNLWLLCNGVMQALPAEESPWQVTWRQGNGKTTKNPSNLCSPGRMKWVWIISLNAQ